MNELILNYTPHDINIVGEDGQVVRTFPSVGIARLATKTASGPHIDGIPTSFTVFGECEGLPDEVLSDMDKNGGCTSSTFYIVSNMIKSALPDRVDLLSPGELVRDDKGAVIGCRSLSI